MLAFRNDCLCCLFYCVSLCVDGYRSSVVLEGLEQITGDFRPRVLSLILVGIISIN